MTYTPIEIPTPPPINDYLRKQKPVANHPRTPSLAQFIQSNKPATRGTCRGRVRRFVAGFVAFCGIWALVYVAVSSIYSQPALYPTAGNNGPSATDLKLMQHIEALHRENTQLKKESMATNAHLAQLRNEIQRLKIAVQESAQEGAKAKGSVTNLRTEVSRALEELTKQFVTKSGIGAVISSATENNPLLHRTAQAVDNVAQRLLKLEGSHNEFLKSVNQRLERFNNIDVVKPRGNGFRRSSFWDE